MERIILTHWSTSTGPEPIIQYPPQKNFPPKDLFLKIWAKHELDKKKTVIEFISEDEDNKYVSIIHKFEGENYFLILVYNQKENLEDIIKDSPEILALISKNLIELITSLISTRHLCVRYLNK